MLVCLRARLAMSPKRAGGESEDADDDGGQNPIQPEHHADRADQRQAIAERGLRRAHQARSRQW